MSPYVQRSCAIALAALAVLVFGPEAVAQPGPREPYRLTLAEQQQTLDAVTKVLRERFSDMFPSAVSVAKAYIFREADGTYTVCGGVAAGPHTGPFIYSTDLGLFTQVSESDWLKAHCDEADKAANLR